MARKDVALSDHERELLSGAAADWPEVVGFSVSSGGDVLSFSWGASTMTTSLEQSSPKLFAACSYGGTQIG